MNTRFCLLVACLLACCLLMHTTVHAKPRATVKYSILREEISLSAQEYLILPFAFSSEAMGTTLGIGGGAKGYGQDQLLLGGAFYASFDGMVGGVLALSDYQPRWANRFFFSIIGSAGYYPKQRAYADPLYAFADGARAGSNDSNPENYVESGGTDNWWEMKLEWILPIGAGQTNSMAAYHLNGGMLQSGGGIGRTTMESTRKRHYLTVAETIQQVSNFDYEGERYEGTIHPIELGIGHNNTDFPPNPSIGSNQFVSFIQDFGWLDSEDDEGFYPV